MKLEALTAPLAGFEKPTDVRIKRNEGKADRHYVWHGRQGGKDVLTRIHAPYGTRAFLAACDDARRNYAAGNEAGTAEPRETNVWDEILDVVRANPDYDRWSDIWRDDVERWVRRAGAKDRFAWMTWADINSPVINREVRAWQTEIARTHRTTADKVPVTLRAALQCCLDAGKLDFNYLTGKFKAYRDKHPRVHINFPLECLGSDFLTELGDEDVANALVLAWCVGGRVGDLCRLTWADNYRKDKEGEWLIFRQQKKSKIKKRDKHGEVTERAYKPGAELAIPVHAFKPLHDVLKRMRHPGQTHIVTLVDGYRGKRHSVRPNNLGERWRECRPVRFAHLHWHDLRGTMAQCLENAGCSDKETGAITGHSSSKDDKGAQTALGSYRTISAVHAEAAYAKLTAWLKKNRVTVGKYEN